MSTLGISGESSKEEGRLKQLIWPTIRNAHDVDLLATQGFWLCQVVAVFSAVLLIASNHPVLALMLAALFFLGGVGIRQTSIAAAVSVFLVYFLDKASAMALGAPGGFGILGWVFLAILLANVRGTILASRWKKLPEAMDPDLQPMRFSETWRDKLCDQLPPKIWPAGKYVFSALVVVYLGLTLIGTVAAIHARAAGTDTTVR